jgi:hypothetical protein
MRNALAHVPKSAAEMVAAALGGNIDPLCYGFHGSAALLVKQVRRAAKIIRHSPLMSCEALHLALQAPIKSFDLLAGQRFRKSRLCNGCQGGLTFGLLPESHDSSDVSYFFGRLRVLSPFNVRVGHVLVKG